MSAAVSTTALEGQLVEIKARKEEFKKAVDNFYTRLNSPQVFDDWEILNRLFSDVACHLKGGKKRPVPAITLPNKAVMQYLQPTEGEESEEAPMIIANPPPIDNHSDRNSLILKIALSSLIMVPSTLLTVYQIISPGWFILSVGGVGCILGFEAIKSVFHFIIGDNNPAVPEQKSEEQLVKDEITWIRNRLYGAYLISKGTKPNSEAAVSQYTAPNTDSLLWNTAALQTKNVRVDVANHLDPLIASTNDHFDLQWKIVMKLLAASGAPNQIKV